MGTSQLIDNAAWIAGYETYERGEPCPWGDESARLGWLAAKSEPRNAEADAELSAVRAEYKHWRLTQEQ